MTCLFASDIRARQRASLREAICDAIGSAALTYDEIAAAVSEDWGACDDRELDREIRELWRAGELRREGVEFVLVDRASDEDEDEP